MKSIAIGLCVLVAALCLSRVTCTPPKLHKGSRSERSIDQPPTDQAKNPPTETDQAAQNLPAETDPSQTSPDITGNAPDSPVATNPAQSAPVVSNPTQGKGNKKPHPKHNVKQRAQKAKHHAKTQAVIHAQNKAAKHAQNQEPQNAVHSVEKRGLKDAHHTHAKPAPSEEQHLSPEDADKLKEWKTLMANQGLVFPGIFSNFNLGEGNLQKHLGEKAHQKP